MNGLRQSHNIWLIDGGEADDRGGAGGMDIMPSQDAIAEFTMMTSNYPPDYGISSGATMSLSLKSGTQKFHGEVYEFNRNTDYDANNYFNKLSSPITPRTSTHYNIFGSTSADRCSFLKCTTRTSRRPSSSGMKSGARSSPAPAPTNSRPSTLPIIPKSGTNLTYVAPVCADDSLVVPKVGDPAFNAKLAADGLTRAAVSECHVIPANLFDPNAVLYLNSGILPAANTADRTRTSPTCRTRSMCVDTVVRIDHKFNDKWTILGHYMDDNVTQGYAQPELGWLWASYNTVTSTLSNPSNSAAIKLSGTINPNLLVEASINYDGNVINILDSSSWPICLPAGREARSSTPATRICPACSGFGEPVRHGRRHWICAVAQRRSRLRAQGRHLVHHGQARHEVRLQLQPLHQEPAAVRRCRGQRRLRAADQRRPHGHAAGSVVAATPSTRRCRFGTTSTRLLRPMRWTTGT